MTTASLNLPLPRFLFSPRALGMSAFALRTWLAAMLALYVSFALQFDSPYWTLLSVWIVAQPGLGMVLSKSIYFFIGTAIGALLGIVLIALFAQGPEFFVLALALLVGGCTVASNLLTNFRAYATVLIGYTAGIVAAGAINTPDQVFFIAMARGSSILTGVACFIFVATIFAPQRAEAQAHEKLREALKDASRRAVYSWKASNETRIQIGRKLIFDLIALNTLIEYASAESGAFRLQASNARSVLAHLFGTISARRALDAHLNRCGWPRHSALGIFHEVILAFLNEMPEKLDRGEIDDLISQISEMREQLALLQPELDTTSSENMASERLVIDRMDDLLLHLGGALEDWRDILLEQRPDKQCLDLNFHRDIRAAWINGLRAFIAVSATGAFWIASAWDHGTLALIFVAVLMSLFSAQPHPDQVGWNFFKAGLAATVLGLICKFLILPSGSGFEYLSLALGLFFFPVGLIMANPQIAPLGLSFTFVFTYQVRPANVMAYDLSDTMNTALGVLLGVLFGTLSYVLIFPPNPKAARRYVTYRIRRGLQLMASLNPIPSFTTWETRMYDRVSRLNDPQNLSGTHTDEWLDAGLGALTLGNEILRLRLLLANEPLSAELGDAVKRTIAAFTRFQHQPLPAAAEVKAQLERLSLLDPGIDQPQPRNWARIYSALAEIDIYLTHHPRLTHPELPVPN